MTKVHDFAGFMKNRNKINEQAEGEGAEDNAYGEPQIDFGANPEDGEDDGDLDLEVGDEEGEGDEEGDEEEFTLEDAKAMIEDLDARLTALEPEEDLEGEEGEEGEGEEGEGEEGAEDLEGEEPVE